MCVFCHKEAAVGGRLNRVSTGSRGVPGTVYSATITEGFAYRSCGFFVFVSFMRTLCVDSMRAMFVKSSLKAHCVCTVDL